MNLSGNDRGFKTSSHQVFGSLVYLYELASNNFGAVKLPLYLGASYEQGNVWNDESDIDLSDLIYSKSLFIGWDSPLGPAFLAYGHSQTGRESFYLSVGVGF